MPSWADLKGRQQESLQEIYNQENERYERGRVHCFVSDVCKGLRATSERIESAIKQRFFH